METMEELRARIKKREQEIRDDLDRQARTRHEEWLQRRAEQEEAFGGDIVAGTHLIEREDNAEQAPED